MLQGDVPDHASSPAQRRDMTDRNTPGGETGCQQLAACAGGYSADEAVKGVPADRPSHCHIEHIGPQGKDSSVSKQEGLHDEHCGHGNDGTARSEEDCCKHSPDEMA